MFFLSLFVTGCALALYPLLPELHYQLFLKGKQTYPYETQLEQSLEGDTESVSLEEEPIPQENRLVMPTIHVDMPIVEGSDQSALDRGVWHRPGTAVPGEGNMVLTGHRIGYAFLPEDVRNSTSFYLLDKLREGDMVIVYWHGEEFDYEIVGYEVVSRGDLWVESQEVGERLTLYTCHPLGNLSKRLVYYARPVETR